MIDEHLNKYNRFLQCINPSRRTAKVRSAAFDLQQAVHEINATISAMLIKVDRKVMQFKDRTDDFADAVQQSEEWWKPQDLLYK